MKVEQIRQYKTLSYEQTIQQQDNNFIYLFLWLSAESVDVKDRGRCDGAAEAGLSAAASKELLPVAGVLTDLTHQTALEAIRNVSTVNVHFTVSSRPVNDFTSTRIIL